MNSINSRPAINLKSEPIAARHSPRVQVLGLKRSIAIASTTSSIIVKMRSFVTHVNIIGSFENYDRQKVSTNIKSLSKSLHTTIFSVIYHALKRDLEKYIGKKVPPSKDCASVNFLKHLEQQKSLAAAHRSDMSTNKIEELYNSYAKIPEAIRPKTATHLIDKKIVVFKLKDISNPKIFIQDAKLAEGGEGTIYKVRELGSSILSEKYIIKVPKNNGLQTIKNEIRILNHIKQKVGNNRHKGIQTPPNTVSTLNQNAVMYMSRKAKGDLHYNLLNGMKETNFLNNVCYKLLTAVKTLSDLNILHGDIKEANCLYDAEGAYLADFGSATLIRSKTAIEKIMPGPFTPGYYIDEDRFVHNYLLSQKYTYVNPNRYNHGFPNQNQTYNAPPMKVFNLHAYESMVLLGKKRDVFAMGKTLTNLMSGYYGGQNRIPPKFHSLLWNMMNSNYLARIDAHTALVQFESLI